MRLSSKIDQRTLVWAYPHKSYRSSLINLCMVLNRWCRQERSTTTVTTTTATTSTTSATRVSTTTTTSSSTVSNLIIVSIFISIICLARPASIRNVICYPCTGVDSNDHVHDCLVHEYRLHGDGDVDHNHHYHIDDDDSIPGRCHHNRSRGNGRCIRLVLALRTF